MVIRRSVIFSNLYPQNQVDWPTKVARIISMSQVDAAITSTIGVRGVKEYWSGRKFWRMR